MFLPSFLIKILAKREYRKNCLMSSRALADQSLVLKKIITTGKDSLFARDWKLSKHTIYNTFKQRVPISNYEDIRPYIKRISLGEANVLSGDRPIYFAITSGTTSGTKYIPITKKMMSYQTQAIKELLLLYAYQSGNFNIANVGMMFIQGSPELKYFNKIPYAKLSGIAARHVPFFLKKNRYPSMETNSINDWGEKIKQIVRETRNKKMGVIGGIPPWVITYFEAILKSSGAKNIKSVFPSLKLYIHGGACFESYKKIFFKLCGNIDSLEVYPASEGFFAYQNKLNDNGLLLLTNHGVFYEFITLENYRKGVLDRICLEDVVVGVDYVIIISTIAGLWAYDIGDTVRFVSKNPYKILFSGRASQYCSSFGEHVIEKEVQTALSKSVKLFDCGIVEFSVCPKILEPPKLSHHQWFIEFSKKPKSITKFSSVLNRELEAQNIYYKDLILSGVIDKLKIVCVKNGGFKEYMKSIGKFGGQNKCPHISNERSVGDFLIKGYVE